jgi:hypothetical protein
MNKSNELPHAHDAERALLGAIMKDAVSLSAAQERLRPSDFYVPANRALYEIFVELGEAGTLYGPDGAVASRGLIAECIRQRKAEKCFTSDFGLYLMKARDYFGNNKLEAAALIRIIKERALLRELIATADRCRERALAPDADTSGLIGSIAREVEDLRRRSTNGQAIDCQYANEIEPEEVGWLWHNRVPLGKLTIIEGDPECGKSLLTIDIAARASTGEHWPDGTAGGEPRTVILFNAEDDIADTMVPRLIAAHADRSRILPFSIDLPSGPWGGKRQLTIPDDVGHLELLIRQANAALVILDPLNAFLSPNVDGHRDQNVRRALAPLMDMAARTGVAVVVVRHLNKSGGTDPMYRGGGSIGLIGAARAAFLVGKDHEDEQRRIFAPIKSNLAEKPSALAFRTVKSTNDPKAAVRIEWIEGNFKHTAQDLLQPKPINDQMIDRARDFLRQVLANGPRPSKEIGELAKNAFSEATFNRARREIVQSKKVGKVWWTYLPGQEDQLPPTAAGDDLDSVDTLPSSPSREGYQEYQDHQGAHGSRTDNLHSPSSTTGTQDYAEF